MKTFLPSLTRRRMAAWMATFGLAAGGGAWAADAPASAAAGAMHHHHESAAACTDTGLACASAATPFVDAGGRLWLVWVAGGAVSVARSDDGGRHFTPAVVVAREGERLDLGADAKPQIAIDAKGHVVVAWGIFKDKAWNAQVRIARSEDDGASFSAPRSLSDDPASQRFPQLAFDPAGRLHAFWLDKRTVAAARQAGREQPGAAVAHARSDDAGASFGAEAIVADSSCECCRLALAFDAQVHPVLAYRALFDGHVRDHALLRLDDAGHAGPPTRIADDHWGIDGCPHQGPALAIGADGTVHAAWFTQGSARQGLFFARSTDGGRHFDAPQPVGDAPLQASRAALLARGHKVWLAWKQFDGQRITIRLRRSDDDGRSWGAEREIASTRATADHPVLVADRSQVLLSWLTRAEGYRLLPVDAL